MIVVDATWVRKFKCLPGGELQAKSRLCARGFMDPQKQDLRTRSTTATRLSQRIVVSVAATRDFTLASVDISGAFLTEFRFDKVRKILAQRGIVSPPRKVMSHHRSTSKHLEAAEPLRPVLPRSRVILWQVWTILPQTFLRPQ